MKNVVSFSGGRTSAYLCYLMKEKYGNDVDFIYMDTGAEHPKTYEFIRKVDKEFNLNLTCLRVVINPELGKGNSYRVLPVEECKQDLEPFVDMMAKYGTPYLHGAFCTDRMKTTPFEKYCNDLYGKGEYSCWLGIRIDEPRRLKGVESKQVSMFEVDKPKLKRDMRYMAEISDFDKQDVLDWWSEQDFDLGIPEPLGNCVFCIKKGNNKIALAERLEPEMAVNFIEILGSDKVRATSEREHHQLIMYRGNNSLESIIAKYADFSSEEIENTIRSMKSLDSGSCSESCEAFSNNLDLFADEIEDEKCGDCDKEFNVNDEHIDMGSYILCEECHSKEVA